jgi:channel protein (hemolysin III family)
MSVSQSSREPGFYSESAPALSVSTDIAVEKYANSSSADDGEDSYPRNLDELKLYSIDDIPERMKDNIFIRGHYRAFYTTGMCLRSFWKVHNETANIWTHFVSLLFFVGYCADLFVHVLQPAPADIVVFVALSLGLVACLGCSTAFHLFNAHFSARTHKLMHKLDYFGITCLIVGSFIPMCYLVFQCDPLWRCVYFSMIGVMGAFGLIGPWFHFWTELRYHKFRMFVYAVLVGSGVFPIVHVNFLLPFRQTWPFVAGLALEILLYMFGVIIYALKVPERWFPGRFDILWHSHMVWHCFVSAAALTHFFTCIAMYIRWHDMAEQC